MVWPILTCRLALSEGASEKNGIRNTCPRSSIPQKALKNPSRPNHEKLNHKHRATDMRSTPYARTERLAQPDYMKVTCRSHVGHMWVTCRSQRGHVKRRRNRFRAY